MAGKGGGTGHEQDDVVDLVFQIEPELRLLEGVVATLRALAGTRESAEPVVIAMLAHTGGEALDELTATWRELREAMGEGPGLREIP